MSWFSKIGNAIGDVFSGVNDVANDINPFKGVTDWTTDNTIGKLGSAGATVAQGLDWADSHPAQVAAVGAGGYGLYAGLGALGAGAGAAAGDAAVPALDTTATNLFADAVPGAAGDVGASALSDAAAGGLGDAALDSTATNLFADAVPGAAGDVGGSALADAASGGFAGVGGGLGDSSVGAAFPSTSSGFGGVGTDAGVMASPDGGLALSQQTAAATPSLTQQALKSALKYGPAGLSLLRSVMGQSAYSKAASQLSNVGATQRATANGLVQGFNNGTLNPAESAGIDKWAQQQVAALRQFYANAGTADSTQAVQAEAAVMAQATQMKNQASQNLLQVGLNELNSLDQNTVNGIKVNLQGDQAAQKAQADFAAQFAKLIGSTQTPAPATTPGP